MKIENLTQGQIVKNYKELCNLLNIKITTGTAKKAQLKELDQYCEYHKEGNKIIIDSIRDKPLYILAPNSKYIDLIGDMLVNYLYTECRSSGYNITLSVGSIMQIVGLVNDNYSIGNRHKLELSQVLNIDLLSVYYFYNNTRGEFKRIIERSLNSLQNRRVIFFNNSITICVKAGNSKKYIVTNKEDDNGKIILNIEKEVLESMGFNSMRELWLKGKFKQFQNKVKKKLPSDWIYYFPSYNLTIGDRAIEIEYKNIHNTKIELNSRAIEKAHQQLKINDKMQAEKLLIDELISLLKYDLDTADNIILKYKENLLLKGEKIKAKYKEIEQIENQIEDIINDNGDNIEMSDYFSFINNQLVAEDEAENNIESDNIPF